MTLNLPQGISKQQITDNEYINLNSDKTKTITLDVEHPLTDGDEISLRWKNGFVIKIVKQGENIKVYKSVSGAYNELNYTFGDTPCEYDNLDTKYYKEVQ